MKTLGGLTLLIAGALSLMEVAGAERAVRLFDGKTFNGWEGNLQSFRIENGAVVGGSMRERVPRNEFLCTTKEFSDFLLRVKFKLLGDPEGANAGIQFRTERIPNHHEVIGYQADVGQTYWGALYDESRRKKVLAGPTPEEVQQLVRPNDWNEYGATGGRRQQSYAPRRKLHNRGRETGQPCSVHFWFSRRAPASANARRARNASSSRTIPFVLDAVIPTGSQ